MAEGKQVPDAQLKGVARATRTKRVRAEPGSQIDLSLFGKRGLANIMNTTTWTTTTATTTTTTYGLGGRPLARELVVRRRYSFPLNIDVLDEPGGPATAS